MENVFHFLFSELLKSIEVIRPEASLLAVLQRIRCETLFPLRMRGIMVCRGLPAYNSIE